jgi:NAD-dependent SIR2 family protein deacetylase
MFPFNKKEHINKDYSNDIQKLKQKINDADSIVIGAGAGLSTSAGFVYNGERFDKYFSDFKEKYGFNDMYTGGFYPYKTPNEFWAFWSRNIFVNRYMDAPIDVYDNILKIVDGKDYFVITTNVDHCFQKSGFDKKRLFYTQGDYGLFQCSEPCCNETFDNESLIIDMIEHQENMAVDDEFLPVCPHCGKPLTTNLRCDDKFVEDEGWHKAAERYNNFIRTRANQKTLFLELGVGYNTPSIIKYPFWQLTAKNPNATYACVNFGEAVCPREIEHQSICINADINSVIKQLLK